MGLSMEDVVNPNKAGLFKSPSPLHISRKTNLISI